MLSTKVQIMRLEHRINLLAARDPVTNAHIIGALVREKRNLEKTVNEENY